MAGPRWLKLEVKTKKANGMPQPHFDNTVNCANARQQADAYVFLRVIWSRVPACPAPAESCSSAVRCPATATTSASTNAACTAGSKQARARATDAADADTTNTDADTEASE